MSSSWMRCGVILGGLACALAVTPAPATADDDAVKAATIKLNNLLIAAISLEDPQRSWEVDDFDSTTLTACTEVVTAVEAAGINADDRMYPSEAFRRPDVKRDDKNKPYMTLDDVRGFCETFDRALVQEWAEAAVVSAWQQVISGTFQRPVEGMFPVEAEWAITAGEVCKARVDAALAAGFPSSHLLSAPGPGMKGIALGEAKALYCQPAFDWGTKRLADINGAATAAHDAIVATYKRVGIKGERLELFVERGLPEDGGWLAPGCRKWIDTAKAMKKAKKMFHWLVANDGTITVRKFTFKGDTYDVSETDYYSEAKAYRGCK